MMIFDVVIEAVNGKELIEKIEKSPTLPDVCITDITMPVQNGFETAKIIRERWPEMKILALSMHREEFSIIKMLRSGANGYIVKDSDPEELRKAIIGVHKKAYYHSELVTGKMINRILQGEDTLNFTDKEQEFLSYCCSDLTYKQIAEKMHLSSRTIEDYRNVLSEKLGIKSRTAFAVFAFKMGLCKQDTSEGWRNFQPKHNPT